MQAQGYRLKAKSLDEILQTMPKMEPRLIGYDEMPLSQVSSRELADAGNLSLENHFNTSVNPEIDFQRLTLNDSAVTNGCANAEFNVCELAKFLSCSQRKSRKASCQSIEDDCNIDLNVHGIVKLLSCLNNYTAQFGLVLKKIDLCANCR